MSSQQHLQLPSGAPVIENKTDAFLHEWPRWKERTAEDVRNILDRGDAEALRELVRSTRHITTLAETAEQTDIAAMTNQLRQIALEHLRNPKARRLPLAVLWARIDHSEPRLTPLVQSLDESNAEHRRVLIVTRDESETEPLSDALALAGYRVGLLMADEDAAREAAALRPDALVYLASRDEPLQEGIDTIARLRATLNDLPVCMVGIDPDLPARLSVLRAGIESYFAAPVDGNEVVEVIDELLAQRHDVVPYRVLLIDDMHTVGTFWHHHLTRNGMSCLHVSDAMAALEQALEFAPDVILMDLYMPTATGTELARIFRQVEGLSNVPIVFMSVENTFRNQFEAILQGGDDFLTKPVGEDDLIRMVRYRARRYRRLRHQVAHDGLTGLLNHSHIKERLEQEVGRARRENQPLSVVMLDLDHFKQINDRHGHPVGDGVIRSLSRLLRSGLRGYDGIGRYGGEEFIIILPNTPIDVASSLLDRLRVRFAGLTQGIPGQTFHATFSAGIACHPDYDDKDELLSAADDALYQAKTHGRNRVEKLQPSRSTPPSIA